MNKTLISIALVCFASGALAQEEDAAAPPPLPAIDAQPREVQGEEEGDVPIPPKVIDENEILEPTVQIRRDDDDNIIEEYRMEGRVYMVKVTPKTGIPYYYIDDDGDGQLEMRESDRAANPIKPAMWKIKEW